MKTEILRLLKERDGFVSGQELCSLLGVSRTAVWKAVGHLREEGYEILAVRNRGYRLEDSRDVVTEAELLSCMEDGPLGGLEYHESIDSTNLRAKKLAAEGAPHATLVVAGCQSAGRGRRGRSWISPSGTGIFMSLIVRPRLLPSCASMLTLVAALSVSDGIKKLTGLETAIKWPNDLVVDGKKVCGILTEMSAELEEIHYVVIGIGINANMTEFPAEVRDTAESIRRATGRPVRRSLLIAEILTTFWGYYSIFMECGNLDGLLAAYQERMAGKGKEVVVHDPAGSFSGEALGIDGQGRLLVQRADGKVSRVVSGEISVRGSCGYI